MSSETQPKPTQSEHFSKRKAPRQKRSRATVDSIKQAALLIIKESGVEACGTESIAERAGVSIGSLYQYFPNKQSIFVALHEDISLHYAQALKTFYSSRLSEKKMAKKFFDLLFDMYDQHYEVLVTLVEQMPHLRLDEQPLSFYNLSQNTVRAYLVQHHDDIEPKDLERKAFIMTHIIQGTIKAYMHTDGLQISRKAFTQDISRIVIGYVNGDLDN